MLKKELNLNSYDFDLPQELIAQTPLKDRTSSRMLVVDRQKRVFYEKKFSDILDIIDSDYMIVRNNTRVLKARFFGKKLTGANVEVFLLNNIEDNIWECLAKPGKRLKPGTEVILDGGAKCQILEDLGEGLRKIQFDKSFDYKYIEKYGNIPLPPYIRENLDNSERYQTVFSDKVNSVAAPTAGLHFDNNILEKLKDKGVDFQSVNLGIGLGTFRPLMLENITDNVLHKETYSISENTCKAILDHKKRGGKVLAVGTTSVRTLESNFQKFGTLKEDTDDTDIFIYPGYEFNVVDTLLTNFHLPKSSLIVMISAFADYDLIMEAYRYAVKERFRFFSFGDCMLIL